MLITGRPVDVGLLGALDLLLSQKGLSYLRLYGDGVDVRIIHVGRTQLFVMDKARKVRQRIGERLVRWGHLDRDTLVDCLRNLEERGAVLNFSDFVSPQILEMALMGQTQDSIDRLTLFPMLEYEIGEQTSVYRGGKITVRALRKRIEWAEGKKEVFLKWRQRLESGRIYMEPSARGRTAIHAAIDHGLTSNLGWDGLQAQLREPLFRIAERLETLEGERTLAYFEKERAQDLIVQRSRWVFARNLWSLALLAFICYVIPISASSVSGPAFDFGRRLLESADRELIVEQVLFRAEQFCEKYHHYPTAEQLEELSSGTLTATKGRIEYLGMKQDFIVEKSEVESEHIDAQH